MAAPQDYTNLATSEYQSAGNFIATLTAFIQPFVDLINQVTLYPYDFDLDVAIGSWLDVDGQWIGLGRTLRAPVDNVYFSFGVVGQGFGEGYWKGPDDSGFGLVTLDDETYRVLLKAKAQANLCQGDLPTIQEIMQEIVSQFPGALAFIIDNHDMSITVALAGTNPNRLFQYLIFAETIPVRPGGVRIKDVKMSSVSGTPLFGFGMDNPYVAGFGKGSWGVSVTF